MGKHKAKCMALTFQIVPPRVMVLGWGTLVHVGVSWIEGWGPLPLTIHCILRRTMNIPGGFDEKKGWE